jgi:esterase/lipase superfamily enzyme
MPSKFPEATGTRQFRKVKVFFATDRAEVAIPEPHFRKVFTENRGAEGQLHFGQCEISIPKRHRMGALETPSLFKLEFRNSRKARHDIGLAKA